MFQELPELNIGESLKKFNPRIAASEDVQHLLNRTLLGISVNDLHRIKGKSKEEIVKLLLKKKYTVDSAPLKDYSTIQEGYADSRVNYGETWVGDSNFDSSINKKRHLSLKNWITGELYGQEELSLRPKMFLFWINFFGLQTNSHIHAIKAYNYFELLRFNSIENYKDLLTSLITHQTLSAYFKKTKPSSEGIHEHTAGKILGQFTFGSSFNDYVSKDRFKRLVKLLNEWSMICDNIFVHYKNLKIDEGFTENWLKYEEVYFNQSEIREYYQNLDHYLNGILKHPVVAQNLTRNLFNYFLSDKIDEDAEAMVIKPVSETFYDSRYDIKGWLQNFFLNDHFYQKKYFGKAKKTSEDFVFGLSKQFSILPPLQKKSIDNYPIWEWIRSQISLCGNHEIANPGISEPEIVQSISESFIQHEHDLFYLRSKLAQRIIEPGFNYGNYRFKINIDDLIKVMGVNGDPSKFVDNLIDFLFSAEISEEQKKTLKETFLFTAKEESQTWIRRWRKGVEKGDIDERKIIHSRIQELLSTLLMMKEYQAK